MEVVVGQMEVVVGQMEVVVGYGCSPWSGTGAVHGRVRDHSVGYGTTLSDTGPLCQTRIDLTVRQGLTSLSDKVKPHCQTRLNLNVGQG